MKQFFGTLILRVKAETPIWFKGIINLSITLAVAGGALLTAPSVVNGFVLPHKIELIAQWLVVAGVVATAVAKTAKTN